MTKLDSNSLVKILTRNLPRHSSRFAHDLWRACSPRNLVSRASIDTSCPRLAPNLVDGSCTPEMRSPEDAQSVSAVVPARRGMRTSVVGPCTPQTRSPEDAQSGSAAAPARRGTRTSAPAPADARLHRLENELELPRDFPLAPSRWQAAGLLLPCFAVVVAAVMEVEAVAV
jgi:hypothetical protein